MKALSLWQPWATLIAIGAKQYETRSWTTSYRGPLIIHAAQYKGELATMFSSKVFIQALNDAGYKFIEDLPLGAGLCIVDLVNVQRAETIKSKLSAQELAFGNYEDGRFAWKLDNLRVFKAPEPMRGAQGLFEYKFAEPAFFDNRDTH